MRFVDGGGLTAKGRRHGEAVRRKAAGLFAEGVVPPEVARQLRVSSKAAYQWQPAWREAGPRPWPPGARAGSAASCRLSLGRSWPTPCAG
ncbi:helix-turn-helix domain-containing protein [Streptomyces sp. NPDC056479]|uniref:helix-turn-helix domain-containing protein n=1 Tax=Streptomyces sp. NPDC056479 TaxID=3345832 RepID=UPI00369F028E